MTKIGKDVLKRKNSLRYRLPSTLEKASIIHHIETKDENGNTYVVTDRNRVTGEIKTYIKPNCPHNFLELHAQQVAAAWGRPTETEMLKRLINIWRP
jgi:hypothetical protein